MRNNPSFLARYLRDGSTAFQCRQTGERYIISPIGATLRYDDCAAYRNGEMIFTGPRIAAVNAVESDARWAMRNPH